MKQPLPPIPPFLRWATGLAAIALGSGYALASVQYSSSDSFFYLRLLPVSVSTWGIVFITAGILVCANLLPGYFLAVVSWGFWEGCFIAALIGHHLQGWGGVVWPAYFVAINGFQIYKWSTDQAWRMYQKRAGAGTGGRHERSG